MHKYIIHARDGSLNALSFDSTYINIFCKTFRSLKTLRSITTLDFFASNFINATSFPFIVLNVPSKESFNGSNFKQVPLSLGYPLFDYTETFYIIVTCRFVPLFFFDKFILYKNISMFHYNEVL